MEMLYDLIVVMGTWPFICQNSENCTLKKRVGDFTVCKVYLKKIKKCLTKKDVSLETSTKNCNILFI